MNPEHKIFEVNLAVSNVCNASCLYCPTSFSNHMEKFMSASLVEKVMEEVGSKKFKEIHPVVHSVCSENGEPFLNPEILDILRIVRSVGLGITMFSNFSFLWPKTAEKLIAGRLVDAIHVNIDGLTPETYRAVKDINLKNVERNLIDFVKIRDEWKSPIRVFAHVISHYTYTQSVVKRYGLLPVKFGGKHYPQDGPETVNRWKEILNPEKDTIGEDSAMFWVERYNENQLPGQYRCPNLDRVKHVAYVNPAGDIYGCCFDSGNDLIIGNVNQNSLMEILQSEARLKLIKRLEEGRFDDIGWPCTRVDACQGLSRGEIE